MAAPPGLQGPLVAPPSTWKPAGVQGPTGDADEGQNDGQVIATLLGVGDALTFTLAHGVNRASAATSRFARAVTVKR